MSESGQSVEVNVLIGDEHVARIDAVKASLEEAGMTVGKVLGAAGVITGTARDPSLLEAIEGVTAVERNREIRLPPPDAPIQ